MIRGCWSEADWSGCWLCSARGAIVITARYRNCRWGPSRYMVPNLLIWCGIGLMLSCIHFSPVWQKVYCIFLFIVVRCKRSSRLRVCVLAVAVGKAVFTEHTCCCWDAPKMDEQGLRCCKVMQDVNLKCVFCEWQLDIDWLSGQLVHALSVLKLKCFSCQACRMGVSVYCLCEPAIWVFCLFIA